MSNEPALIFKPTPEQIANTVVRIYNEGRTLVYIGGPDVTPETGIPVTPKCEGGKPVELNTSGEVYSVKADDVSD